RRPDRAWGRRVLKKGVEVKLRRLVVLAVALATAAASTAALAATRGERIPPDSLRALGAPIGLRVGVAVNPFDLDTPAYRWDVANELFTDANPSGLNPNDFWISHLGPGIVGDAFRWAHAADPRALLFYNDYNIAGEDGTNAKSDAVYAFVQKLLAQGVPID